MNDERPKRERPTLTELNLLVEEHEKESDLERKGKTQAGDGEDGKRGGGGELLMELTRGATQSPSSAGSAFTNPFHRPERKRSR